MLERVDVKIGVIANIVPLKSSVEFPVCSVIVGDKDLDSKTQPRPAHNLLVDIRELDLRDGVLLRVENRRDIKGQSRAFEVIYICQMVDEQVICFRMVSIGDQEVIITILVIIPINGEIEIINNGTVVKFPCSDKIPSGVPKIETLPADVFSTRAVIPVICPYDKVEVSIFVEIGRDGTRGCAIKRGSLVGDVE